MFRKTIRSILKNYGYDIVKTVGRDNYDDLEDEFKLLFEQCRPYTLTSIERMYSLYQSIGYILKNNVEGDFAECGAWRGGSAMLMAFILNKYQIRDRKIYIYDTFEGMPAPSEFDLNLKGETAASLLESEKEDKENSIWCLASIEDVQHNLQLTGFPKENIEFIKGKVEITIPEHVPDHISLLRLDTDWYESTKHELLHLYPRLSREGVLIIDDYGHWQGARKATDEYFSNEEKKVLLHRIDYTGRIAVKL